MVPICREIVQVYITITSSFYLLHSPAKQPETNLQKNSEIYMLISTLNHSNVEICDWLVTSFWTGLSHNSAESGGIDMISVLSC